MVPGAHLTILQLCFSVNGVGVEERVAPGKEMVAPGKDEEKVVPLERVAPERVEKRKRVQRSRIISAKPICVRAVEWVAQLQVS